MKIDEVLDEVLDLFEMANLRKSETGLPVNIYVSSGGTVNERHGPRIKVMNSSSDKFDVHSTVSVMLKKDIVDEDVIGYNKLDSKVLNAVRQYINLNYDCLMGYWKDEISTTELVHKLKKI